MAYTTDSRTETWLNFLGCKWEYNDAYPIAHFKDDWRTVNPGRKIPIEEETAQEYALKMENGSPAPPLIGVQKSRGLELLDGRQRAYASELRGDTSVAVYLVSPSTSNKTISIIAHTANASINGQHTPDREWMLANAVAALYFHDDCSAQEIARAIGRKLEKVEEEICFQKTVQCMEATGYSGKLVNRNKKWLAVEIGKHADETDWYVAPKPLKEMLECVDQCNFTNGQIDDHIETFFDISRKKGARRDTQFSQKLDEFKSLGDVSVRINSVKRSADVENILPNMRRTTTIIQKAIKGGHVVRDEQLALLLTEQLKEHRSLLKQLIDREVRPKEL